MPQQPDARLIRRLRAPGPQGLVILGAAAAGARVGLQPISDNSTLVHLRTGIDLVRTGHVPRSDPYSFTAAGHAWVVQSWLASLLYGLGNAVGHHALVLEQGALMAALAAVVALLAHGPTAWRTGLAATLAIAAGTPGWSPRPLLLELLCLGLTILIVERRLNPAWLIPVVWVWVNSHGSYPVGLAWLGARGLGEAIDVRGWPRVTLPRLGGFVAGLAVAVVNPLTWRLLAFPLVVFGKSSTFQGIVEWRSPNFQDAGNLTVLVFVVAALVVLLRARLPWAQLLPVCGFLAMGLIAERNLAPLAVVLAPALAAALAVDTGRPGPGWATTLGGEPLWRVLVTGIVGLALTGVVIYAFQRPTLALGSYPVAAANFLEKTGRLGPSHRIAETDVVGCFLIWRAGPSTKVFIDDRYDMYPTPVVADARDLDNADANAPDVLARHDIDTVLWASNGTLPANLLATGQWKLAYHDAHWEVVERVP